MQNHGTVPAVNSITWHEFDNTLAKTQNADQSMSFYFENSRIRDVNCAHNWICVCLKMVTAVGDDIVHNPFTLMKLDGPSLV